MEFEINEKILISKITTFNYIKNNPNLSMNEIMNNYFYLYELLGFSSNEDKKIIEKQVKQNLDMLKEMSLIIEKDEKISLIDEV